MSDLRAMEQPVSVAPIAARFPPPDRRWPQYEADEIGAVVRVLASGRVNSLVHGDECRAFEREFAAYCGMPHAISLANGTLALELAFRALGIGAGDEVIVPARSFFASASAVAAVGAVPVFADIDANSHTIDPAGVEPLIGARTRAILCVHLAGWPCDMAALDAIAAEYGLWLVEDCAQAHGAAIGGRKVGSFGHAAAFSFCTDKILSTGGEGGMLLLREEAHWRRAWAYKDHGKNVAMMGAPSPGNAFRYLHESFGTNWRMTEMQAAIGRAQLRKLPAWLARRRAHADRLRRGLGGHPLVRLPVVPEGVDHAFYKFYLMLEYGLFAPGKGRADIIAALNDRGIPAGTGSCPDMSRELAVRDSAHPNRHPLPVAAEVGERSLMLCVDHLLDAQAMDLTIDTLVEALDSACDPDAARPFSNDVTP
ncbi:DegT/DnrJ/EryC1/StrS family aminotransferase [Sphingobium cloacae]|uniref:Glutamine--scyllo-inositol transaminase n=1 Tax=Sphingobium cloacae TaxID=120107 RepID=A0A1E1F538_9SPHN|nr:DegT/DnrJ/EryC1/StrS family aminotransferase [Sphingobium cloacae]BAV65640.1 glutamine--scyllo-inositol transaminase [Sphingobium cloacae]